MATVLKHLISRDSYPFQNSYLYYFSSVWICFFEELNCTKSFMLIYLFNKGSDIRPLWLAGYRIPYKIWILVWYPVAYRIRISGAPLISILHFRRERSCTSWSVISRRRTWPCWRSGSSGSPRTDPSNQKLLVSYHLYMFFSLPLSVT